MCSHVHRCFCTSHGHTLELSPLPEWRALSLLPFPDNSTTLSCVMVLKALEEVPHLYLHGIKMCVRHTSWWLQHASSDLVLLILKAIQISNWLLSDSTSPVGSGMTYMKTWRLLGRWTTSTRCQKINHSFKPNWTAVQHSSFTDV